MKAAVAGTPQAKEALIANAIPQTAAVKLSEAKIDPPQFDGEPKLAPIEGTSLQYVVNTATPIIQVSPSPTTRCRTASGSRAVGHGGPWAVATSVPSVIYSIPPSSPLHYVTYVRIYDSTPDSVVRRLHAGLLRQLRDRTASVVYGTGYYYPPYVGRPSGTGRP